MRVYRARSRQRQEVVLNAAHVAVAADVDVFQVSRLELVLGQHALGHDAVGARGLHEQNHLVAFDLRLHELLGHFLQPRDNKDEGERQSNWSDTQGWTALRTGSGN